MKIVKFLSFSLKMHGTLSSPMLNLYCSSTPELLKLVKIPGNFNTAEVQGAFGDFCMRSHGFHGDNECFLIDQ